MTFGLTPQGFNAPRLADIKNSLENAFIAEFGDVNTESQSVVGQLIGIFSKSFADLWENLEDVYLSQYPNSADGVSLDNVVQLNGITRLAATQTSVVASCTGNEGTFIPAGSIARIPTTGQNFAARIGATISGFNANSVSVAIGTLTTQPYTIALNSVSYTYSLPVVTFSNVGAIFVTGNVIRVTMNGVQLAPINFTTDSNTTLAAIASAIQGFASGSVCTAVVTNPDIITITPLSGQQVAINLIQVTGGATQASYAVSFLAPGSVNALSLALVAILNDNQTFADAIHNVDDTIIINADDPATPFSCAVGSNLSIISRSSPVEFLAEDYGVIPCPVNTLTQIVTQIAGWNSVTNLIAGATGTETETDAELRIRRQNSIKLLGSATVEAIRAGLLQKVSGVTSATVFENVSLQELPIVISFPLAFTGGDVITIDYDEISTLTVNFNTNQATTMADIVTALETIPAVLSASFGGTGNQVVTVLINVASYLKINSATVSGVTQEADITGGRPPKSFEAIVEGGSNLDVANQIWQTKPAGIETFGNTSQVIVDSMGNNQVIYFSRPIERFIWVEIALTLYSEEAFPVNGTDLVAQAINSYLNSLGVGVDVLFQRVLSQIFVVPGIASGDLQIAVTAEASDSPSFGTADIPISETQIAVSTLERITVTIA